MSDASGPKFLSQADFARRRGVTRKAVTGWKQKGLLVVSDVGLIDVEASEWNLDQRPATYRGGVTHRPIRAAPGNTSNTRPGTPRKNSPSRPPRVAADIPPPAPAVSDVEDGPLDFDPDDPNLDLQEAVRRKENFLGLQRKQDYEVKQSSLVNREAAERFVFEIARDQRDAWEAWPSRIATIMADELGIDARTLTTVLTAHVKQHLEQLGEPETTLPRSE
ncbi:hypothetical protein [Methylobacterium sp. CM6244]